MGVTDLRCCWRCCDIPVVKEEEGTGEEEKDRKNCREGWRKERQKSEVDKRKKTMIGDELKGRRMGRTDGEVTRWNCENGDLGKKK